MNGIRRHLSYSNVMATLAVVIAAASGSTAVAISASGKNADVSKKGTIRAGRVNTAKIADGAITASKLAEIHVVQASSSFASTAASCPAGERLLSGGGTAAAGSLTTSHPEGNAWRAGAGPNPITVYALCQRG